MLADEGYSFTSITPATHARVVRRKQEARTLRDVFGWSLPFTEKFIPGKFIEILPRAKAIESCDGRYRSRFRVSSLDSGLFLHSAYPTSGAGSVFFGPDTYRFAALIRAEMLRLGPVHRINADIFGEELDKPAYRHVERIAAVGAIIAKAH